MSDAQHVYELFGKAIAERGEDYVYQPIWMDIVRQKTCLYRDPDTRAPSCIVGMVLHLEGITTDEDDEGVDADEVARRHTEWSPRIRSALRDAQTAQDQGKTWGEATEVFRRSMGAELT